MKQNENIGYQDREGNFCLNKKCGIYMTDPQERSGLKKEQQLNDCFINVVFQ